MPSWKAKLLGSTAARYSTSRTLKEVDQQYPFVFLPIIDREIRIVVFCKLSMGTPPPASLVARFQELVGLSHRQGCFCQQQGRFFQQQRKLFPQLFGLSAGLARMVPQRATPWQSRRRTVRVLLPHRRDRRCDAGVACRVRSRVCLGWQGKEDL